MQNFLQRKSYKILLLPFLVSLIFFISCAKLDTKLDMQNENIAVATTKFFKVPSTTDPLTLKVINEIKTRNDKKEFVSSFAVMNGYPVWDKALILVDKSKHQTSFSNSGDGSSINDTIFLIPLVLINETKVNGFIKATLNEDIRINYSLAQDYKNYSFATSGLTPSDATRFAFCMIYLNKKVFADKQYNITDSRLFSSDTINKKTARIYFNEENQAINLVEPLEMCDHVNVQYVNCAFPTYAECTPVCDQCSRCMSTMQIETCITINTGDDGGSSGTGTGGGDGGVPHSYPCPPGTLFSIINGNSLTDDPISPCPPPAVGMGWEPTTLPCDPIITGLLTNTVFKDKFTLLSSSVPNPDNYETGEIVYDLGNAALYSHIVGTPTNPGIPFSGITPHKAIIHRHYNGINDMFSTGDLFDMARQLFLNNVTTPQDYFWAVIGPYEVPYIMKVKDVDKLKTWYSNVTSAADLEALYGLQISNNFFSSQNVNNKQNEIGMLGMLKDEGLFGAVELYKGNLNFNAWSRLSTNGRSVNQFDCN